MTSSTTHLRSSYRGYGEWLNTAIYRFRPDDGFLPATTYTARIAPGLADTRGAVLDDGYSWIFTTVGPQVVAWSPEDNDQYRGADRCDQRDVQPADGS